MVPFNFLRQPGAPRKGPVATNVFRQLALAAALLLAYPGNTQNMPVAASRPTGDQLLYGKDSPANCRNKTTAILGSTQGLTASADAEVKPEGTVVLPQEECLSRRERRAARQRYRELHTGEFPAIYQPGIE